VVEGQAEAAVAGVDDGHRPGVVAGPRLAAGPGEEDRRDRVQARVASRIGIGPELAQELDLERGLFAGFPDGRRLERFPVIHEAAGKRPAGRGIPALDENDAPSLAAVPDLDDDVDGGHGIAVFLAAHGFTGGTPPF
jgi:hypothetical protein